MRMGAISSCVLLGLAIGQSAAANLIGIETETGNVYSVSITTAAVVPLGTTGLTSVGDLVMGPDGFLYTFGGYGGALYRVNPATFAPTLLGPMGLSFVSEGGMAFSPNGTLYIAYEGGNSSPKLFTVSLTTGAGTVVGTISGGSHDVNGLVWRSDGKLVGLDRVTNALLEIDPVTAVSSIFATVTPTIGAAGGATVVDGVGYFNTGGPYPGYPGSNELWTFDLFTGSHSLIGSLGPGISSPAGLVGIAPIPETCIAVPCLVTIAAQLGRRRARHRSAWPSSGLLTPSLSRTPP